MPPRKIKERLLNAILKPAKIKLGFIEFVGPALVIYPVELILIGLIIAAVIIAVKRPEIIINIIEAASK